MLNINKYKLVGLASVIAIFIVDIFVSVGFATGYIYLPALLIIALSQDQPLLKKILFLCIGLTCVGAVLSPNAHFSSLLVLWHFNRLFSIIMLCLGYACIVFFLKKIQQLDGEREALETTLNETNTFLVLINTEKEVFSYVANKYGVDLIKPPQVNWMPLKQLEAHLGAQNLNNLLQHCRSQQHKRYITWSSNIASIKAGEPWISANGKVSSPEQGTFNLVIQVIGGELSSELPLSHLSSIFDITPCFSWVMSAQGEIEYINTLAAESISPPTAGKKLDWTDIVHPADRGKIMRLFLSQRFSGFKTNFEFRVKGKEQKYLYLASRITPFYDTKGNLTKIVGFGVDITSLNNLILLNKAWTEVINNAEDPAIICEVDKEYEGLSLVYVNQSFEKLTGYSEAELVGNNPFELLRPKINGTYVTTENFAQMMESEHLENLSLQTQNGETKLVDTFAVPVSTNTYIVIVNNMTELVGLRKIAERNKRMDSIGHLTGGVAHDFNNMLAVISGNIELARLGEISEKAEKHLSIATDAANQAAKLTASMLLFARGSDADLQAINLSDFFRKNNKLFNSLLHKGAEMVVNCAPELIVLFDETQLESVFSNLISNANDAFLNVTAPYLCISTSIITLSSVQAGAVGVEPGEFVKLTLADNGSGIHANNLDDVFSPFFTTKPKSKGTGLGLSLIYTYMKFAGGAITIASRIDEGTTFNLYFKRAKKQTKVLQQPLVTDTYTEAELQFDGKTVLVVEDKPRVAEVAKLHLENLGYKVRIYRNGEELANLLPLSFTPDLLFTDIAMPGKYDGYRISELFRQFYPQIPIIYTSGLFESNHELRKQPNTIELKKPYTARQLMASLAQINCTAI